MYYVAHRLFAAHDRHLGALIAAALAEQVGDDNVFLPFCDTDEENLQAAVKGQRLYDLDRARLRQLRGMIAVLHGPSLDDGVCMEIGYAAHLGAPIVIVTTDFQTYGLDEHGPALAFPDPLVETVAPRIVRVPHLGSPPSSPGDRFVNFAERNRDQIHDAIRDAVDALLTPSTRHLPAAGIEDRHVRGIWFYEPSPYTSGPDPWRAIHPPVPEPSYRYTAARLAGSTRPHEAALADWTHLHTSDTLIVDIRGPETPPGAALLIGASRAAERRIIALTGPTTWTFAHGREPNYRNLMIQYAVDERVMLPAHSDAPVGR